MHRAEGTDSGEPETWEQEVLSDAEFQKWLDSLHDDSAEDEFMDGEDAEDGERGEQDVVGLHPYLGAGKEAGINAAGFTEPTDTSPDTDMSWLTPQRPAADGLCQGNLQTRGDIVSKRE